MSREKRISVVAYKSIIFTRAEILFSKSVCEKGITCIVHGTCLGKEMSPIKITAEIAEEDRLCSNCEKEIIWFMGDSKTEIINYLPASNELIVRVEIKCNCKVVKEIVLLLSLNKEESQEGESWKCD